MDFSIIVPSFNGGVALRDLTRKITETLSDKFSFELLFIFDNGTKKTWQIIQELKSEYPALIKAYRLARNYGQHRAIQFGFSKAIGDFVITIDEDMQHNPADILKLTEKQKDSNYDIVYGRFTNLQHNEIRNIISGILKKILRHFIPTLYEDYSPYRLIKRDTAIRTSTMVCPYTFIDDFLSRITQNVAFVDITHFKRFEGRSSYTFRKLIKQGIFIFLAYSRVISWLLIAAGVIMFFGALLFIIGVVSPDSFSMNLINNITIVGIFGVGLMLIIISLLGTLINQRNIILNTRPVKLLNENTI